MRALASRATPLRLPVRSRRGSDPFAVPSTHQQGRGGATACPTRSATAWRRRWRRSAIERQRSSLRCSWPGSGPFREALAGSFPIDRRALTDHQDLQLTEARVRGAIKTLEAVGFLERAIPATGSQYKQVGEGLHRKPILFVFGSDYAPAFIAANRRAAAARGAGSGARRPPSPSYAARPSTTLVEARPLKSPKSKSEAEKTVLMGEVRKPIGIPPKAFEPDANLEAALERLKRAIGKAGGGSGV